MGPFSEMNIITFNNKELNPTPPFHHVNIRQTFLIQYLENFILTIEANLNRNKRWPNDKVTEIVDVKLYQLIKKRGEPNTQKHRKKRGAMQIILTITLMFWHLTAIDIGHDRNKLKWNLSPMHREVNIEGRGWGVLYPDISCWHTTILMKAFSSEKCQSRNETIAHIDHIWFHMWNNYLWVRVDKLI
jgi:hypothetical protein